MSQEELKQLEDDLRSYREQQAKNKSGLVFGGSSRVNPGRVLSSEPEPKTMMEVAEATMETIRRTKALAEFESKVRESVGLGEKTTVRSRMTFVSH